MNKKKPRVVIDTNLFISGVILPRGPLAELLDMWLKQLFILVIARKLIEELYEVLHRPKFTRYNVTEERITTIIEFIKKNSEKAPFLQQLPLIVRDSKDEKVLACALGGKVDYLVTGDEDLLTLNGDPKLGTLKIIKVKDFLTIITTPIKKWN